MLKNILTLLLFIGGSQIISAQATITIEEDYPIEAMMNKFVELNKSETFIPGWRIQLMATTDRQKVDRQKAKFQSLYPNIPVDWTHSKPYYKLRAGAYRTRLDAIRAKKSIKNNYPGAYPAKDKIRKSELL